MDDKQVSFAATIAYGLLAIGGLLVAGIFDESWATIQCALLSAGAAYVAQALYTEGDHGSRLHKAAVLLQFVSVGLWLAGLFNL